MQKHRLSVKHENLGHSAHIFFISVPQVHLPGFWLIVPHLHSGEQLQAYFPMVLKDLSFCHPSALKSAFPFSTFTTLAFTISLPQVHLSEYLMHVFKRGLHHFIECSKLATTGRGALARNFRGSQNLKGSEEFLKPGMNRETSSFSGGVNGEPTTQKREVSILPSGILTCKGTKLNLM